VLDTDAALSGGSDVGNAGGVETLKDITIPEVTLVVPPLAAVFLIPEGSCAGLCG
jgi:1,4-alpha-glucan branching enzyme